MHVVMLCYEIVNLNYTHLFIVTDHGDIVNGKACTYLCVFIEIVMSLLYVAKPPAVVDGK